MNGLEQLVSGLHTKRLDMLVLPTVDAERGYGSVL